MSTKTEFKHNTAVADEIDEALLRQSPWDDGSFISEIHVIVEDDGLTEDDEWSHHLDDREVWVCGAESVTFSSIDDWWDDVQQRWSPEDEGMAHLEMWDGYVTGRSFRHDDDDISNKEIIHTYWEYLIASIKPEELPDDLARRDSMKAKFFALKMWYRGDKYWRALEVIEGVWNDTYTLMEILGQELWNHYLDVESYEREDWDWW